MENLVKKDLFSGEVIPYKNKDFYNCNLYLNKKNLISHFKTIKKEEAEEITKKLLLLRKEYKKIKYCLSTVESASLIFPSVILLKKIGIDYEKVCKECKLKYKYNYNFKLNKNFKPIDKIYIDTREQKKLKFNINTEIATLSFGDYSSGKDLSNTIVIERKSGIDFIGTLSQGFERFCKEIIKAEESNSNILIIVEEKINNMLSFDYLPQYRWVKAKPFFIFSRLRELLQSFPNIQIVFVDGVKESSNMTKLALSYGKDFLKYDIQYLYLTKQLDEYIK